MSGDPFHIGQRLLNEMDYWTGAYAAAIRNKNRVAIYKELVPGKWEETHTGK